MKTKKDIDTELLLNRYTEDIYKRIDKRFLDNELYIESYYKELNDRLKYLDIKISTLNDEPKEPKKIEKIENKIDTSFENANYSERMRLTEMVNKLNEIIDYINRGNNEN